MLNNHSTVAISDIVSIVRKCTNSFLNRFCHCQRNTFTIFSLVKMIHGEKYNVVNDSLVDPDVKIWHQKHIGKISNVKSIAAIENEKSRIFAKLPDLVIGISR